MACEQKRGCGYRKAGGIYLVGGGIGVPCDRLPLLLCSCPTCGQGIRFSRGFSWVDVNKLVSGRHILKFQETIEKLNVIDDTPDQFCHCGMIPSTPDKPFPCMFDHNPCDFCHHPETMGRAGLLWIGSKFYERPEDFIAEGKSQGFSRRIRTIPRGFKVGETWILLAHNKAVPVEEDVVRKTDKQTEIPAKTITMKPGVFYVWKPERVERIFLESQRDTEEVSIWEKKGATPIFVPDADPDHQGDVHTDAEQSLF